MADRGRWIHGRAVDPKTRALRFASVSAIEGADHAVQGCTRAWWFEKIGGRKRPDDGRSQQRGQAGHSQLASYLSTGVPAFGPDVSRGLPMVPSPGKDLLVEWDILLRPGWVYPNPLTDEHSPQLLADAPLKLDGVPLLGNLDLSHARCENKGAEDVESTRDPDGTVEVLDWKFVGGDKYLKTPETLKRTTQMACYAEWVWRVRPETTHVRLSHGYFLERGRSRKVTTLVTRDEILPQVEHAAGVVRLMAGAAQSDDPEQVPANLEACDKYGGCCHKEVCTARMRQPLSAWIGQTSAARLTNPNDRIIPVPSLLQRAQSQQPQNLQPAGQAAQAGPDAAAVAAERARLEAETRAARLKALVPPGFEAACAKVRSHQRGFPKLTGRAAVAYLALGGQETDPASAVVNGSGEISYVTIDDPATVAQLDQDLVIDAQSRGAEGIVPSPLPPDAPPSDPRYAVEGGMPGHPTPGAAPAPAAATVTIQPQLAMQPAAQPIQTTAAATPPAEPEKTPAKKKTTKKEDAAPSPFGPVLFIDAVTNMPGVVDLQQWAHEQADKLAHQWGALDVRSGGQDTPLGYDKWRGALTAFVRDPKSAPLPEGNAFRIETRFSSVYAEVAGALELRFRAIPGGLVVRGVR